MPPNVAVAAQLDALQRNDYPETDAGVQVAYRFTKPAGCEQMTVGQVRTPENLKDPGLAVMFPVAVYWKMMHVGVCRHSRQGHVAGMQKRSGWATQASEI